MFIFSSDRIIVSAQLESLLSVPSQLATDSDHNVELVRYYLFGATIDNNFVSEFKGQRADYSGIDGPYTQSSTRV